MTYKKSMYLAFLFNHIFTCVHICVQRRRENELKLATAQCCSHIEKKNKKKKTSTRTNKANILC